VSQPWELSAPFGLRLSFFSRPLRAIPNFLRSTFLPEKTTMASTPSSPTTPSRRGGSGAILGHPTPCRARDRNGLIKTKKLVKNSKICSNFDTLLASRTSDRNGNACGYGNDNGRGKGSGNGRGNDNSNGNGRGNDKFGRGNGRGNGRFNNDGNGNGRNGKNSKFFSNPNQNAPQNTYSAAGSAALINNRPKAANPKPVADPKLPGAEGSSTAASNLQ
jgi:hypothetical protein